MSISSTSLVWLSNLNILIWTVMLFTRSITAVRCFRMHIRNRSSSFR